jgi:hypothetical protein
LKPKKFGFQEALERGVKIRFITEKPPDEESLPCIVKTFRKRYFFKVKYLLNAPSTHIGMFDKKKKCLLTPQQQPGWRKLIYYGQTAPPHSNGARSF